MGQRKGDLDWRMTVKDAMAHAYAVAGCDLWQAMQEVIRLARDAAADTADDHLAATCLEVAGNAEAVMEGLLRRLDGWKPDLAAVLDQATMDAAVAAYERGRGGKVIDLAARLRGVDGVDRPAL